MKNRNKSGRSRTSTHQITSDTIEMLDEVIVGIRTHKKLIEWEAVESGGKPANRKPIAGMISYRYQT